MKDLADLVKRLRDAAENPALAIGEAWALLDEAADKLEASRQLNKDSANAAVELLDKERTRAEAAERRLAAKFVHMDDDGTDCCARAKAAEARAEELMSTLDCHAGFCSHHVECNGPVAKHRGDPK
jgi:hypothetical protein